MDVHGFDALPEAYVDLLGVYLGDGSISSHPHGVHRLRIVLDLRYPGLIDEVARAPRTIYVSRKADVGVLDRHIGPKT